MSDATKDGENTTKASAKAPRFGTFSTAAAEAQRFSSEEPQQKKELDKWPSA